MFTVLLLTKLAHWLILRAKQVQATAYPMATAIGKHVGKLTQSVFCAHGFAYAQILTNWEAIIGPELANYCQPERLRWPAGQERIKDERRRLGGTLTVKVEGPAAIELQHETPRVIERVNTFYGYQAVTAIKVIQGTIDRSLQKQPPGKPPVLPSDQELDLQLRLSTVPDETLRNALSRLGRGAINRKNKRRKLRP